MKFERLFHYILKDKEGYSKDETLKQRWETYLYVLKTLRIQSFPLLKDKFIYFLKFKKLTSLKRLTIFLFLISSLYFAGKFGIYTTKNYLSNKFGWFKDNDTINLIQSIYVPDTIDMKIYIKRFKNQAGLGDGDIIKKFEFVTVYTVDSTKTLKKFLYILGTIESGNDYKKRRPGSQYLGYWAMGDAARRASGFGSISYEKFLSTPAIQDAAIVSLLIENYKTLKPYLKKYDNKIIRGYHLTTSGMLAMAHNCGPFDFIKFLNSNCSWVPRDANGTSDRFLILGNYDLSSLKPLDNEK